MVRERTTTLGITSFVLVLTVLVWFNYPAVLPQILNEWQLTGLEAGVVLAAFQAGYLTMIIPAGVLADHYSERWIISVGATGTGLASLAFAVGAHDFLTGTVLRFIAGLFMAGVYVPGMRFISSWFSEATRGRALGVYVGAYSTSSGISFFAASSVAATMNWRTAIAVTSMGALLAAPLLLGLTGDPPNAEGPSLDASSTGEALKEHGHVDRIHSQLTILSNREYLLAVSVYTWHAWELFGVRSWLLAFLTTLPVVMEASSPIGAGSLMALVMIVGGPGNLLGGWLSDRVGRLSTIGVALSISAIISLSMGFFERLSLPTLSVLLLVYGIALTADSAPTSTTITEVVDEDTMGTALSIQSFIGFAATAASPIVFGVALDAGGYLLAFPTLALAAGGGLLSVLALRHHGNNN